MWTIYLHLTNICHETDIISLYVQYTSYCLIRDSFKMVRIIASWRTVEQKNRWTVFNTQISSLCVFLPVAIGFSTKHSQTYVARKFSVDKPPQRFQYLNLNWEATVVIPKLRSHYEVRSDRQSCSSKYIGLYRYLNVVVLIKHDKIEMFSVKQNNGKSLKDSRPMINKTLR